MKISVLMLNLLFVVNLLGAPVTVPPPGQAPKEGYSATWSGCDVCEQPESVYYDQTTKTYYVSNVVGGADQKDGVGFIQKIDEAGKVIAPKWVEGLNAPKGIRVHGNKLYVADIDHLIVISVKTGRIEQKIPVPGSKFLNDVAVDASGSVYVSDTIGNKIYKITMSQVEVFLEDSFLDYPNGLLVQNKDLIVASWGKPEADFSTKVPGGLYKINLSSKKQTMITKTPFGNLDGLEVDQKGNYLVSDWMAGKVYKITKDGKIEELFIGMKGAADIGYNPRKKTIIIPRMNENQITAFDLSKFPTKQ